MEIRARLAKKDKKLTSQRNFNLTEKEIFESFSEKLGKKNFEKNSEIKQINEISDFLNEFGLDKNIEF